VCILKVLLHPFPSVLVTKCKNLYYSILLGPHHMQPSAYYNFATYPLSKYKPTFRAVCCVPEEILQYLVLVVLFIRLTYLPLILFFFWSDSQKGFAANHQLDNPCFDIIVNDSCDHPHVIVGAVVKYAISFIAVSTRS